MTQASNLTIGRFGEKISIEYLKKKGYSILSTNVHKRGGELDIVATHHSTLVFVEVKCRRNDSYGTPEEAITPWKMRALINSANYYKLKHPNTPDSMRIDVVSIVLTTDESPASIKHFENVSGF